MAQTLLSVLVRLGPAENFNGCESPTLSGHTYARQILKWRSEGFRVKLVFLSLPTAEDAIARVAARVQHGGHDVPADVIRRRFAIGLRNFLDVYRDLVDYWQWIATAFRTECCWKKERTMSESWESKLSDSDMQAVPKALVRAAKRAREMARLTNTPLVVVRNGVRVEERVEETTDDPLRGSFKELLEQMPEVGTDEDFKRSDDPGRPVDL